MKKNPPEETEKGKKPVEEISEKIVEKEPFGMDQDKQEKKELLTEKEIVREKLEEEFKKMKSTPDLDEEEIEKETEQIKSLEKEGKLSRLLGLAREKGTTFAIAVARNMKDPYILDAFHDILAREGFYKKFLK